MIKLPQNKESLARIMWQHSSRGTTQLMYRRTLWLLAWYYLNGYRRFQVFDPSTGSITPHFLDEQGNLEFQSQDLLYKINETAGRLMSGDYRPSVLSNGTNLGSIRNRSVAQILADSTLSTNQLGQAVRDFSMIMTTLGGCGIQGIVEDHPSLGLTNHIEVIHPKELIPFPSLGENHTQWQGIMRIRTVTLDRLYDIYGKRKVKAMEDDMEWYEVDPGQVWDSAGDEFGTGDTHFTGYDGSRGANAPIGGSNEKDQLRVARINELWQLGPQNTVQRFVVSSADAILDDQDLSGLEVYNPIGYARFFDNGTFWGAGMFELLYSIHREMEQMTKSLFRNIRDIDRYGVMVMPQGEFNQNSVLKEIGSGLRALFWEPDPIAEGFTPFSIQPFNAGDVPGKVAQFAREQMEAINPVRNLIEEKGRIDSAAGLGFLDEQINKTLTSPSHGIQQAFGNAYKASTQRVAHQLMAAPRPLQVDQLTLDLAGAVIDPEDDTVSFENNPLPSFRRLHFTVRSTSPKSEFARKQEAIELWGLGIDQDPMAFKMFAYKEGLDFAMWTDDDKGAFEQSIKDILILYGDGETPGEIMLTPYTVKPEMLLRLLSGFMTGPHMRSASIAVHQQFKSLRETMLTYMGLVLPGAIPNPDEAALLSSPVENMTNAQPAQSLPPA